MCVQPRQNSAPDIWLRNVGSHDRYEEADRNADGSILKESFSSAIVNLAMPSHIIAGE